MHNRNISTKFWARIDRLAKRASMNQNVKHRLSKNAHVRVCSGDILLMYGASKSVRTMTKKKAHLLWSDFVWFWLQYRCHTFIASNYLLHYAGSVVNIEKGVYCYCYATNNFYVFFPSLSCFGLFVSCCSGKYAKLIWHKNWLEIIFRWL